MDCINIMDAGGLPVFLPSEGYAANWVERRVEPDAGNQRFYNYVYMYM